MSIQSLRASLESLNTTPGARSSSNTPQRTIYHQFSQDLMLIQGIHYAVEEALSNVGELMSLDPLLDPGRRCLLRLQQSLIDIAQISENIQGWVLHKVMKHASTSRTPGIAQEPTPQEVIESHGIGSVPLSTPARSSARDQVVTFRFDSVPSRSNSEMSENLMPFCQATHIDPRYKRKAPDEDDDHVLQPPPAKRQRRPRTSTIYLRPTDQRRGRTSIFGWARRMFSVAR